MAETPSQRGYLTKNLSVSSTKQMISRASHDRSITITCDAVKSLITQFFDSPSGKAVLQVISPDAIHYETKRNFDPNEDHTARPIQVATLVEQVKETLPSILIINYGYRYVPTGISPLERTTFNEDKLESVFRITREIPLSIIAATQDMESCSQIMNLLQFLFGDLRSFFGSDQLVSEYDQDEWIVTVPRIQDSDQITSEARAEIGGDPKDRFWTGTISFPTPFIFEDFIKIQEDRVTAQIEGVTTAFAPEIIFPNQLKINARQVVTINHFNPTDQKVTISDARVASIDPNTLTITPRKYGSFIVRVISKREPDTTEAPSQGLPPKILAEHNVSVIP